MNLLYIIVLGIALIMYFIVVRKNNKEYFTTQENLLAANIVALFKTNSNTTFISYLTALNDNKNTSDNLISKGVYKKFKENANLTTDDVLREL